jgi:uncharacterized membrane protein YphA (DoxX/SURF4 family)
MTTATTLEASAMRGHAQKSVVRHLPTAARALLGFAFFTCGLNGFLNFLPQPTTPMPDGAVALTMAFMKSGYMFQLVAGTQLVAGAMLLLNRFLPLALAMLAPVVVNIVLFHVFLAPEGLGVALFVLALELYLAWAYRGAFSALFVARTAPSKSN